jgi:hypothetical protein
MLVDTMYLSTSRNRVLPMFFYNAGLKRSATNMFCSIEMLTAKISLFLGPVATQVQINSEPTLTRDSSIMNSSAFFFFVDVF